MVAAILSLFTSRRLPEQLPCETRHSRQKDCARLIRPGDIATHCFNEHTVGVIDEKTGKIKPSVRSRTASVTALMQRVTPIAPQRMTSSANNAPVSEL
jgi:hypothetical protein